MKVSLTDATFAVKKSEEQSRKQVSNGTLG
jgi:hypothetical protein